jgi:hypothetical protein
MPTRPYGQTPRRGRIAHGRPHLTVIRSDEPPVEPRGGFGASLRASGRVATLQLTDELEAKAERLASLQTHVADRRGLRSVRAPIRTTAALLRALARASAAATRDVLNA